MAVGLFNLAVIFAVDSSDVTLTKASTLPDNVKIGVVLWNDRVASVLRKAGVTVALNEKTKE